MLWAADHWGSTLRNVTKAIAGAGIALVLSGGAAAAANGSLPDAAQDGLSTASDHVGIELPASKDNHPTADDHPGGAANDGSAATEHPDNHGADVSAVAQSDETTGREHGEAVSTVARDGHGANAGSAVETPNAGGIGTAVDASGGANSVGVDHAADQASVGSGNAGAHGTP